MNWITDARVSKRFEINLPFHRVVTKRRKTRHYLRFVLQWINDVLRRNRAKLRILEKDIEIWKQRHGDMTWRLEQLLLEKQILIEEERDYLHLSYNCFRKYKMQTLIKTCVAQNVQKNTK